MRLLLLLLLLAAPALAQFAPPDKSFSVQVPGQVEVVTEGPPTYVWGYGPPNSGQVYMFGYYQVPTEELKGGQASFEYFVKIFLEQNHVTESTRKPVGLGKSAGYDVEGTREGKVPAHARLLANLGQSRYYFLLTFGKAEYAPFFSSFAVK